MKKAFLILTIALTLSGCTMTGGTVFDERVSAEIDSEAFSEFCAERKQKALAISTAGFLADTASAGLNAVSAPVMVVVDGASGQLLKNPTTEAVNARCQSVWEKGDE